MEFNSSGAKIKQYKFQIKGTVTLDAEWFEYLHRIYLKEKTKLNFYEWVNESVLSSGIMHVENWCSGLESLEYDEFLQSKLLEEDRKQKRKIAKSLESEVHQ